MPKRSFFNGTSIPKHLDLRCGWIGSQNFQIRFENSIASSFDYFTIILWFNSLFDHVKLIIYMILLPLNVKSIFGHYEQITIMQERDCKN